MYLCSILFCMSFQDDINMFIPKPEILKKFMAGTDMPEYVFKGTNENVDFAVMFASMLKYSPMDFYGKLVATVEPYSSNSYDVRYFASSVYRDSMRISATDWEECIYGYGGMENVFQGAALIKADMFDGCWIGIGYMDFDYLRRRTTMLSSSLKNKNIYYEGTDMINIDVLKNVSTMLRGIHNMSALYKSKLPLQAGIVSEQSSLYRNSEPGNVNFRSMTPEDLEYAVKAVLAWRENGIITGKEVSQMVLTNSVAVTPDVFWDLITCGVDKDYTQYEGLSREYVKALMS